MTSAKKEVDVESLLTKEELEQIKDMRVTKLPTKQRLLGEGAFGKVLLYKFENESLGAGKKSKFKLSNKTATEKEAVRKGLSMALGEMTMLHQLNHERIVKLFGIFLNNDQVIIFMEYMMRGSVKEEIVAKECLSELQAMHYFIQAAEGLVYLHSRKPKPVIHRDIKSENLLLTFDYNVKLADFGLAVDVTLRSDSFTNSFHAPTSTAGTCHFMAPEVIRTMGDSASYGRASDIWSLACTLVEMISGNPPYRNLHIFQIAERTKMGSNNPLNYSGDLLVPSASIAVKRLLNALFEIERELRPSANAVLANAQDAKRVIVYSISDPIEQANIASMFEEGRGIPRSDEEALKWYKRAADQAHTEAKRKVQILTETVANNKKTVLNGTAANQYNDLSSTFNQLEANGKQQVNATENITTSRTNKTVNALSSRFEHQIALNQIENTGEQPEVNKNIHNRGSGQELEVKDAGAQNELGDKYYFGQGVPQSYEEAVKWFRKAAEQGNAVGQFNLGIMYENGWGVDQLYEEAVKWYTKAAEQGDAQGQRKLGFMYENGWGVDQSYEEALKWFQEASKQDNTTAQVNIGFMYQHGWGVDKSYEEAVKWYTKAAEQGDANGQNNLGAMYENGYGVDKSDEEAVKWYTKAAEQGEANGQNNLGGMYENGYGVDKSYEEAVKWYTKAAEQGHENARKNLEYLKNRR